MMKNKAIIVDLDGTLIDSPSIMQYTNYFDNTIAWDSWIEATRYSHANHWCMEICKKFYDDGYKLLFLTARTNNPLNRDITEQWLTNNLLQNNIKDWELIMRDENDTRMDSEAKLSKYLSEIAPHYNVLFAIDDKKSNIDLWRHLGIAALHCADY